jgi:DNA-binding response OmpR family regulator
MARILIAEDEPRIAAFVEKGLRANGYTTVVIDDGIAAEAMARDEDFDLLILDLGLPQRDGMEVLAGVRRRGEQLPIIILTARREVSSTVDGLEAGADDYLPKPFRFEELLARVRARLRTPAQPESTMLQAGDLTLDLRTRRRAHRPGVRSDRGLRPPRRPGTQPRAAAEPGLGL